MVLSEESTNERPSREIRKLSVLLSTDSVITSESGITKGLTFRVCGATGAITKSEHSGISIGPPTLNEYPVDPVGVATINPSAW